MSLDIKKIELEHHWSLEISGSIDESADFSKISHEFSKPLHLDFNGLNRINSAGIRHWICWLRDLTKKCTQLTMQFYNCPKILIDQINMIEEFIPKETLIKSFKVPFFCDDCQKDEIFIFVMGKHYHFVDGALQMNIPKLRCNCSDGYLEMDVAPKKYFQFLDKQAIVHQK